MSPVTAFRACVVSPHFRLVRKQRYYLIGRVGLIFVRVVFIDSCVSKSTELLSPAVLTDWRYAEHVPTKWAGPCSAATYMGCSLAILFVAGGGCPCGWAGPGNSDCGLPQGRG